jgi:hypothetical protein
LTTTSSQERRFTDREVQVILRRASNAETSPHLPTRDGPTLSDLVEAAREVGLDVDAVRRAAASAALPLSLGPLIGALLFLVTPVVLARPLWRRSDNKARVRLEELAMELPRAADERTQ